MNDLRSSSLATRRAMVAVIAAAAALLSPAAVATSYAYDNRTVDFVGVVSWGTYGGFVWFVEGVPYGGAGQVPHACWNAAAFFDQTQTNSKYWYMTFLTAKASGTHVAVDITQDAYDNCYIVGARLKT